MTSSGPENNIFIETNNLVSVVLVSDICLDIWVTEVHSYPPFFYKGARQQPNKFVVYPPVFFSFLLFTNHPPYLMGQEAQKDR